MAAMTVEDFQEWIEVYGKASEENDLQTSAELFAQNAIYYENPFAEPMIGKDAIYRYWEIGSQKLKDKMSSYEILALNGNVGIARWQARFLNVASGNRIALDCVFLIEFDEHQKCRVFREWWHSQVIEAG